MHDVIEQFAHVDTAPLEKPLRRLARQRPVLVITGARQTGKTSLVRRLFPRYGFVSLDLPSEAEQAERQPNASRGSCRTARCCAER